MGSLFTVPLSVHPTTGRLLVGGAARDEAHGTGLESPLRLACRVHGKWERVAVASVCHYDLNLALVKLRLLGHILLAAGAATCEGHKRSVHRFDGTFGQAVADVPLADVGYAVPRALVEAISTVRPFETALRQLAHAQFPPHRVTLTEGAARVRIVQERRRVPDDALMVMDDGRVMPIPCPIASLGQKGRRVWLWCARHRRWHCVARAPLATWRWAGLMHTVARVFLASRCASCDEYAVRDEIYQRAATPAFTRVTLPLAWLRFRNWARAVCEAMTPDPTLVRDALAPPPSPVR